MNRQNIIEPYNGILLRYRKEQTTDSCSNIDESQKHYSKWKKPDQKATQVDDLPKSNEWLSGARRSGEGWLQIGTREFGGDSGNILSVVVVTQLYTIARTHQNVQLRWVNFTAYKVCLNKAVLNFLNIYTHRKWFHNYLLWQYLGAFHFLLFVYLNFVKFPQWSVCVDREKERDNKMS